MITPNTVIKKNPSIIMGKVDEEYVMLSVENSQYYGLDSIGSRIWDLLQEPKTIDELVVLLQKEYSVDYETCYSDTLEFIETMIEKKMVLV